MVSLDEFYQKLKEIISILQGHFQNMQEEGLFLTCL